MRAANLLAMLLLSLVIHGAQSGDISGGECTESGQQNIVHRCADEYVNLRRTLSLRAHVVLDLSHADIQTLSQAVNIYRSFNAAWQRLSDKDKGEFTSAVDRISISIERPDDNIDKLFAYLLQRVLARVSDRQRQGWPSVPGSRLRCDEPERWTCGTLAMPAVEHTDRW